MMDTVSIILADDHPLFRKGLKDLIEEQRSGQVVGEANDGLQVLELIDKTKPTMVIIDIDMPKLNGLEVAKEIQRKKVQMDIIVLTMYDQETIFNEAMDLGVMGYVLKDSAVNEILDAISTVAKGRYYFSPSLSSYLAKRSHYGGSGVVAAGIATLTSSERKILKRIAEGRTTKEIANELFISIRTVETHRSNICKKLNLFGTNSLLRFALEHHDVL